MNFTAIDFETANGKRNSACALGLVRVENGKIVLSKEWLISPPEMYFHPINISIHGITENDVRNKPSFNYIWEEIQPYIENQLVIAHNASFDLSVLRSCLETYGIQNPKANYLCTVQISKKIWPGMPNHKLDTLAHLFDIPLRHHNALDDTLACAKIALKAAQVLQSENIIKLSEELKIQCGKIFPGGYTAPKKMKEK